MRWPPLRESKDASLGNRYITRKPHNGKRNPPRHNSQGQNARFERVKCPRIDLVRPVLDCLGLNSPR